MRFFRPCLAALLFLTPALAVPIVVHNTGVNISDVLVAPGASTAFWTLQSAPGGATEAVGSNPFRYFIANYYGLEISSAWVSMDVIGNASAGGFFVYQLAIDLSGLDPSTAVITGTFGTDNDGFIRLNGGANVATTCFACFGAPTAFSISSGFVAGINTIEVGMNNGGNPTAFRVEFTSADADASSAVPEPSSLLIAASAVLAGLFLKRYSGWMRRP
ncbi:MAG: PEP-CTERM sorting domain-containing protein [Acidobacteria bacterium]|nr:PEP-CTERM sorting domain-containing protein [Acidobacteriota bacterium]